jgi:hypothetical protein
MNEESRNILVDGSNEISLHSSGGIEKNDVKREKLSMCFPKFRYPSCWLQISLVNSTLRLRLADFLSVSVSFISTFILRSSDYYLYFILRNGRMILNCEWFGSNRSAGGEQNNGNTKKLRIRIYLCFYI